MYLGILNHMKKIINPWHRSAEGRLQGKNHEEMNEEVVLSEDKWQYLCDVIIKNKIE